MPCPVIRDAASAVVSIADASMKFAASLNTFACCGAVPTRHVFWPMTSKMGCTRAIASSAPAATIFSLPAAATSGRPSTGAATYATPCRSCRLTNSSQNATEIVAMFTWTNPFGARSSKPLSSSTARNAESSASMENTASPANASSADATTRAPCSASAFAASGERFQTRTVWPAFNAFSAIAPPMLPSPINPISMSLSFVDRSSRFSGLLRSHATSLRLSNTTPRDAPALRHGPKHAQQSDAILESMTTATFRFHRELNEFLARPQREQAFAYVCPVASTTKHMIEALGVPHTEVGLILRNGLPAGFDTLMEDADFIDVYPPGVMPRALEIVHPLRAPLRLETLRFIADAHLGGLAQLLRLAGFDTRYDNHFPDDEIEL